MSEELRKKQEGLEEDFNEFEGAFDDAVSNKQPEEEAQPELDNANQESSEEGATEQQEEQEQHQEEEQKEQQEEQQEEDAEQRPTEESSEEAGEDVLQKYKSLQGMWRSERKRREELEARLAELEQLAKSQQSHSEQISNVNDSIKSETKTEGKQQPVEQEAENQMEILIKQLKQEDSQFVESLLEKNNEIKELKEDFPEIASALEESLKNTIAEYSAKQTLRTLELIQGSIAPILQEKQQQSAEEHYLRIKEKHPDFEEYLEDNSLVEWIEQQNTLKRKVYTEVFQNGTADEVIEMLNDFKKSVTPNKDSNTPKKEVNNSQKKEQQQQRLSDMEEPTTRRTVVNPSVSKADINDFEAAFEEAVRQN